MEDVAEGFLNELKRRSLVQVAKIFLEKVTKCRVHDLLRDFAIQKASDTSLFDIYHPRKHSKSSSCIRLAIHSQGERYHSLDLSNLKLRSIMFFDPVFPNVFQHIYVFRHIYVFYLHMDYGGVIPDAIGSLYHLKLLSIRSGVCNIPSSIGNLKNLQTLVVVNGYALFCQLPRKTADLERWDLGTSAMPLTKALHIYECPNLKEIPERTKDLKKHEETKFFLFK